MAEINLTDKEKQQIIDTIKEGRSLPKEYIYKLFADDEDVFLFWNGRNETVTNAVLPFHSIEHIDEPRKEEQPEGFTDDLFATDYQGRQLKGWTNKLIWGDNKLILSSLVNGPLREAIEKQGGLKLIYIDPPFAVGADFSYNITVNGEDVTKQQSIIEEIAYRDTWGRGISSYLSMMYERLKLMHQLLAEDGSIYVHLDERTDFFIRIILDEIFGFDHFMNHIIWYYPDNFQGNVNRFANNHNIILSYKKSHKTKFERVSIPLDKIVKRDKRVWDKEQGKIVAARDENGKIIYEKFDSKYADDVWSIGQSSVSKKASLEFLGYPTQKPEALLERIIKASSNEGDLVADFFCVRKGTPLLIPPASGGIKGGNPPDFGGKQGGLKPIEQIQPGEYVYGHDSKPRKVLKSFKRQYSGTMIGIGDEEGQVLWLTEDHLVLTERRVKQLTSSGGWSGIPRINFERAREMRKDMTPPERKLWNSLRTKQMKTKFRRQHPIGPYIADFYCRDCGLVIEVDGQQHLSDNAQEYDQNRNKFMESIGLDVLRFTSHDLKSNFNGVMSSIFIKTRQHVLPEDSTKQWRYAGELRIGDIVFSGCEQRPVKIMNIFHEEAHEQVYDIQVEGSHSYITGVCAIHNCGSGTTAAVAEKLGRKWIACDLGRFAVHTTRKRMIQVQRKLKKEGNPYRAFEVLNLGKYERQFFFGVPANIPQAQQEQLLEAKQEKYILLILEGYSAQRVIGHKYLHGKKASRFVHVGPLSVPVTKTLVEDVFEECRQNMITQVDILGFEFEMGLVPYIKYELGQQGVDIRLRYIPREAFDRRTVEKGKVKFYDVAYVQAKPHIKGRTVKIELTNFATYYTQDDLEELEQSLKKGSSSVIIENGQITKLSKDKSGILQRELLTKNWVDWIDYWSVDFDYEDKKEIIQVEENDKIKELWTGNYVFENIWQSFRTKKNPHIELITAPYTFQKPGKYKIMIKVVDIVGVDTSHVIEVDIK